MLGFERLWRGWGTFAAVAALSTLQACAAPTLDGEEGSSASEVVTESTFQKASSVVEGIDYLAFGFKADGCYARALYMSAELAAKGIESNAIYAIARDEENPLRIPGRPGGEWSFHVAPMLNVAAEGSARAVARVLDPSISASPLTHVEWVGRMGYAPEDKGAPLLRAVDGARYLALDEEGFTSLKATDVWHDVPSFGAMKKFDSFDLQLACSSMHAFLELEAAPNRAQKQAKLIARTRQLFAELTSVGKLDGDPEFDESSCEIACRPLDDETVACGVWAD